MKRINLDQMKNMSIDNLIELYRDGYRLEEHTPIASLSNIHSDLSNIHTLQGPLLDPVVNFGKVTVSTGYDAAATSIILNTNEGSKLPVPSVSGAFNLVWWNSTDYPDPSDDPNKEIVRCTAITTDTLTVARPQEGTSASVKNLAGKTYKMILSPTAKTISDISSTITARVVKSGDTMTGTLNLPSNGLIVGTNQIIVSGGNVGIGTTGPISKLDVQVDTDVHISFGDTGAIPSGDGYLRLGYDGINEYGWISPYLGGTGIKDLILQPWGGNVGIGTTSPGYRSDINGSLRVTGAQSGASSGAGVEIHYDSANNKGQIYAYDRTAGSSKLLTLQEAGGDINFAANKLFINGSSGNVGIGTVTPGNYKLAVEGSIRIAHIRDILSATVSEEGFIRFSGGDYVGMRMGNANAIAFFTGRTSKNVTYTSKNDGSRYFVVAPTDVGGEILPSTTFTVGANTYTVDWYRESQGWVYVFENISGEVATGILTGLKVASRSTTITSGGNVGIGTTNPTAKLHIGGTPGVDGIKFPDGTTQTTAATLTRPKTTGSFTGNGSANRAIAHGLGMVPFQVMLWDGLRTVIIRYKNTATPVCQNNHVENGGVVDTTLWDATYFYVTGATEGGNTTGATEYWTAYA